MTIHGSSGIVATIGDASADAQPTDSSYRLCYDIAAGAAVRLWIKA